MAPLPLKRLTASQATRMASMKQMGARMQELSRVKLNKNIVKAKIDAISNMWEEACKTHSEIVAREDAAEDVYISENVFSRLQEIYEETWDALLTMQLDFEEASGSGISNASTTVHADEGMVRSAKLPKLDLPSFSGKYEDWPSFCGLFTNLVHSVPGIADSTKLQYLKLCFKGEAAEFIKHVEMTDDNYASTWQAVKKRYYNPRRIMNKHMDLLLDLEHLKRESANDLKEFVDKVQGAVRALKNLGMPVEHWDAWLIRVISSRLDSESRKLWEAELSARDARIRNESEDHRDDQSRRYQFPKFKELIDFIEGRVETLSMIVEESKFNKKSQGPPVKSSSWSRRVMHAAPGVARKNRWNQCPMCNGSHALFSCRKFLSLKPVKRREEVRRLRRCYNCLGNHRADVCPSNMRCTTCSGKHHISLHLDGIPNVGIPKPEPKPERKVDAPSTEKVSAEVLTVRKVDSRSIVLLATARVGVSGSNKNQAVAKVFIDSGSQVSMITEDLAQRLRLPRRETDVPLTGLGGKDAGIAKSAAEVTLHSLIEPSASVTVELLVRKRLTHRLPSRNLFEVDLSEFGGLQLADPHFDKSECVDIIIGADIEGHFAKPGLQKSKSSALIARNTILGWVFSGPPPEVRERRAETSEASSAQSFHVATDYEIQELLPKFWELEEVPQSKTVLSVEEERCEKQFVETHRRSSKGRFVVQLPFKCRPVNVGAETRRIALGSLASTHRKFLSKPELGKAYKDFMKQYEDLGHMSPVPKSEIDNNNAWYLPHHAVIQERPEGPKIRVVFDAARKIADGSCLNDHLMPGPALQGDLGLILINWRRYKYVFTADIVKMFRQMRVMDTDRDYQRIVWSPSNKDPPVDYRLNTVTYGTASAPFLAIRTLQEIATKEASTFPLGAKCLIKNTYVDDTFAGSNDLSRAIKKKEELIALLRTAQIELDKWAANDSELLPSNNPRIGECGKRIDMDSSVKTLGVTWKPDRDCFHFEATINFDGQEVVTKRVILSKIARLFDPLGWLAPVTILAKVMLQDLWILKFDWDVPVPEDIQLRWNNYCQSMSTLSELSVDRWLGTVPGAKYQLHGFSDASVRAFAAVVYLRIENPNGEVRVVLVASKSKVAPVKTVSIPNLELCGAVLLVKLVQYLQQLDFFKDLATNLWTDSQIVLAWLDKHPSQWKTFVANRVSLIQTELPGAVWRHVSTKANPADVATRGMLPNNLMSETLWWSGPHWLCLNPERWEDSGDRKQSLPARVAVDRDEPKILCKFSSLTKLWRVFASLRKLLGNWRRRKEGLEPLSSPLTVNELEESRTTLIRLAQLTEYRAEFEALRKGQAVAKTSRLRALNPILDSKRDILLVGGRLERSDLSTIQKHPPILPKRSALSKLYIRFAHVTCMHGGPTLTSSILMQYVWIVGQRQLIKTAIKKCVVCQKNRPRLAQQIMGDLPASRVTPARPFTRTGLDYAGPFLTLTKNGRGQRSYKCWVALFICFTTRAIHLEMVRDLTTAAFLAALRRFMSRRGRCRYIYSDNASTFKGAAAELAKMFTKASDFYGEVAATLANDGIEWTFIPPTTPHYGGLWEAGVKSVKHHLRRAIGDYALTFEEFSTVLAEIEVCLNSRPLCPLSGDVEDLDALTPSHLLIGETSALLPDLDLEGIRENRLDRYQKMQRIRDQFWRRWSSEYLHHLQERGKWREVTENFKVGALVLVADDRYPPSKWPMGRILEVYPGQDGRVRVVSVKTVSGIFKRHIARLSPLYCDET